MRLFSEVHEGTSSFLVDALEGVRCPAWWTVCRLSHILRDFWCIDRWGPVYFRVGVGWAEPDFSQTLQAWCRLAHLFYAMKSYFAVFVPFFPPLVGVLDSVVRDGSLFTCNIMHGFLERTFGEGWSSHLFFSFVWIAAAVRCKWVIQERNEDHHLSLLFEMRDCDTLSHGVNFSKKSVRSPSRPSKSPLPEQIVWDSLFPCRMYPMATWTTPWVCVSLIEF